MAPRTNSLRPSASRGLSDLDIPNPDLVGVEQRDENTTPLRVETDVRGRVHALQPGHHLVGESHLVDGLVATAREQDARVRSEDDSIELPLGGCRENRIVSPIGRELGQYSFRQAVDAGGQVDDDGQGSIMMVVATDAPLSPLKLERLAKRAVMGLARTGSFAGNGSGDYVIAFSTATGVRRTSGEEWTESVEVTNSRMSALFEGTVEATEEAIYNSLLKATTVSGMGRTVEAIDVEAVTRILEEYNVGGPPVPR